MPCAKDFTSSQPARGFTVAPRGGAAKNGSTVVKTLAGLSEADQWMRKNPRRAAQVATRWVPGLKQEVAEAAIKFNVQQADRRLSANDDRTLWSAQDGLQRLGLLTSTFDVNEHVDPGPILRRWPTIQPSSAIPAEAALKPGFTSTL